MEEKIYKQCQSCGMPLKGNQGSEADETKSNMYCNLCYQDGKFYDPDMTLEEMEKVCNTALKEMGWIAPLRWAALWQIPTLKRWKK